MNRTIKPIAIAIVKASEMIHEQSQILSKAGKEPGFTVPEGYFEGLTSTIMSRLPEVEITDVEAKPTWWMRVRPYVYLAAMFAGVWCMMTLFNHLNSPMTNLQRVAEIAGGISDEHNADEFVLSSGVDAYDILTYEDSVYGYMIDSIAGN